MKNDLTGIRFGRLLAIKPIGKANDRHILWECKCDCGKISIVASNQLRSGHTRSCGCFNKDRTSETHKKHGARGNHSNTERLYKVWISMRKRCNNEKDKNYKYYGKIGITVCEEWDDYAAFKCWALKNGYDGKSKRGLCTIDRINPYGNYEPSNCRWVSMEIQNKNKRARMDGGEDDGRPD